MEFILGILREAQLARLFQGPEESANEHTYCRSGNNHGIQNSDYCQDS